MLVRNSGKCLDRTSFFFLSKNLRVVGLEACYFTGSFDFISSLRVIGLCSLIYKLHKLFMQK